MYSPFFFLLFVLCSGLCHVGKTVCYVDTPTRVLQGNNAQDINPNHSLYNGYCAWLCFQNNSTLAGTEDSDECYCGDFLVPGVKIAPSDDCNMQCFNYPNETCGGAWRISVFAVNCCANPPEPEPKELPRLVNPCISPQFAPLPFCNASLPLELRISDALSRMTIDDKVAALSTNWNAIEGLGLPAYDWWSEATHGVSYYRVDSKTPFSTNFAFPITTAMSFNRSLWRATGSQIAHEARAIMNAGNAFSTYWAPVINLARDPRWGRNLECPGEDPYLTGQYAAQFVTGFQESSESPGQLLASACCKHFVANEMEHTDQNGIVEDRESFDATVPMNDLIDSYMAPFQVCVEEGKVSGVMCSYNAVNGIPSCANDWLLKEVLRDSWGFDGYITSDCDADSDVFYKHNYTKTPEESVRDILRAGTDVDCGGFVSNFVQSALKKGLITLEDIDKRLRNLFRVRYRLGHFDASSPLNSVPLSVVCSPSALELARDGVTQSAVLVKNSGILPLASSSASKLFAVIGPNTNLSSSIAGYYGPPNVCNNNFWTMFDAISQQTLQAPLYSAGTPSVLSDDLSLIDDAVATAQQADFVVLVVGTDLTWAAEGQDAASIVFNKGQRVLIERVAAAARQPIIVVLLTATPLDLTDVLSNPNVGAIIHAGMPSVQTLGIGDLIFGKKVPAGRLVQTFLPSSYAEEISIFDFNMRPGISAWPRPDCTLQPQSLCPNGTNPGRTYRFFTGDAVLPFGFGLSYTQFQYNWSLPVKTGVKLPHQQHSHLRMPSLAVLSQSILSYQCTVTNIGKYDADEVVLGFISPPDAGKNGQPLSILFGFERVFVPRGKSVTVFLYPQLQHFLSVQPDGSRKLVGGNYTVQIGIKELPLQYLKTQLEAQI